MHFSDQVDSSKIIFDQLSEEWGLVTSEIWPQKQYDILWPNTLGLNGVIGLEKFSNRWKFNN